MRCHGLQKESPEPNALTALSTEHDGPIPRLALEQLPEADTNTRSTASGQPASIDPLTEASHEDVTDAIAEGFGLPDSVRGPVRPPSEAPSDAFTDMPQGAPAGRSDQELKAKPAVSSLYERILAQQQQAAGLAKRKSSSSGAGAPRQKGVPDPSDWARQGPTPEGAALARGVPDPSDWQHGGPTPAADVTHQGEGAHSRGVPDPSDWQRGGPTPAADMANSGGGAHSRGVPDPSDWRLGVPTPAAVPIADSAQDKGWLVAEQQTAAPEAASHDAVGSNSRDSSPRGVKEEAASSSHKGAQKYSYLQQIGVIGKGPPPLTVDPGRGRQQLRPSPRRPSVPGEAGGVVAMPVKFSPCAPQCGKG